MLSNKDLRELMRETLNENLIRDLKITAEGIERLVDLYTEKHLLLNESRKLAVKEEYTEIRKMAKELTQIEFKLQEVYGMEHNMAYHKFWEIGGCICEVMANIDLYPSESYLVRGTCPIHGPKKK